MFHHTESAAATRSSLLEMGIKEPLWQDFHWTCKYGPHIRCDESNTFRLTIEAEGRGYKWKLERV